MKAILLSVQPKWLEKILNGEKTIEIRKTAPKCDLPIDVYLYCTKETLLYTCGHLIFGQEVFDDVERYSDIDTKTQGHITNIYGKPIHRLNGSVVAKFTLRGVDIITTDSLTHYVKEACLTEKELDKYFGVLRISPFYHYDWGYAWHINNLEVFDEPKGLGEFRHISKGHKKLNGKWSYVNCTLSRPPQSWQYVEVHL